MYDDGIWREVERAEEACLETAKRNGYSKEMAENCENFSVACLECPFMNETEKNMHLKYKWGDFMYLEKNITSTARKRSRDEPS